jgi:hypothetical protein
MTTADQRSLTRLYSEGYFTIPDFQRNYAWKSQQIRDLMEDVFYLHRQQFAPHNRGETDSESSTEIHYFGQVLLQETGRESVNGDTLYKYDIIDGQQRLLTVPIFVRAILDELSGTDPDPIPQQDSEDDTEETPQQRYNKQLESVEDTFFKFKGKNRVEATDADSTVFDAIIDETRSVSDDLLQSPSTEYLKQAYDKIREHLQEYLLDRSISEVLAAEPTVEEDKESIRSADVGDRGDVDLVYSWKLIELLQIISEVFTVTRFIIESTSEAGRFFETQNDRGRALTTKDKIKGYLIYCANRLNDDNFAKEISRAFKHVTETITQYDGADEDTVETFLSSHWRMFNGDPTYDRNSNEITDIHRCIKMYANHAHLEREDTKLEAWISTYITSLQKAAEAYGKSRFPHSIDGEYTGEKALLTGIRVCGSPSNTGALLTAVRLAYAEEDDDRYEEILGLIERFMFRVYQLSGESKQAQRAKMNKMAYKLHWADQSWRTDEDANLDIFTVGSGELSDHPYKRSIRDSVVYDDLDTGFDTICDQIESGIGNYAPRFRTRSRLNRTDILEADDADDTWNGLSTKGQKYLFLNFENHLRSESASGLDASGWPIWDGNVNIMPLWNDKTDQDHGLETGTIDRFKSSISALFPFENHSPEDLDQDWETVFKSCFLDEGFFIGHTPESDLNAGPFTVLWDCADRTDDVPDLDKARLEKSKKTRVAWAVENWAVNSKAQVIAENADEIDDQILSSVASDVRNDYKRPTTDSYNIPHVEVIGPDEAEESDDWQCESGDHDLCDAPEISELRVYVYHADGTTTYQIVEESDEDPEDDSDEDTDSGTKEGSGPLSVPPYRINRVYYSEQSDEDDE